jgi:signal transduction histidine kinase
MFGSLNERQLKYLKNISLSGNRLLNLINDILDISGIESGDVSLSFENIHIADVFWDVNNIETLLATSKHILIKFSTEPADLEICADKIELKQILHKIVNNALKFTPENEHIEVKAKKSENKIEISIRDNGIGIPEDKLQVIFEPFKQVDSSLSRMYSWTGLGLTIVKHLVEIHDGEIKVKSELTKGSTFTVFWPVKEKGAK